MSDQNAATACPACGASLSPESACEGLCLACLMELAVEPAESPEAAVDLSAPTLDLAEASQLAAGQILGERYRLRSRLGLGGMGEVWRATDLKLRVDIALKALRDELVSSSSALESLRQEVRTAREVISPNVCRVFDLVEVEDRELVSMEYIDGMTLLDILRVRAPLDLTEAREIASQFLAGLEAIHDAGLVHRDVKPENLMMTRSGRVVLMDFGIAKGLAEGKTGTVSGTPAYMAPEQARGEPADAAADVFSAGIVLAEMIAPGGAATLEARQTLWRDLHADPPQIPESPWSAVIERAVAPRPERRPPSAAALSRALEEVALRTERAEGAQPYPGLAAFSATNADFFFGRELETEELWKRLRRPQLYGLIGPSGAGKSSFLRAGLLAAIPTGWDAVVVTPGSQPFANLARALVPQLSGDTEALQLLIDANDPGALREAVSAWRRRSDQALLVVDQFEELFTLAPTELQTPFAELLGQLALDADVHVLLSIRDDFLFYCSEQPALAPMFSELTPLRAPAGSALRRALVQPALKCGYRFENDSLVDEMLEDVGRERGALPMLAFAAARLWEHRDRERGLLTREAYEHTGGVGGALARHSERTLEQIGQDHIPIARELFRNLVTSQGTRSSRSRAELLSIFSTDRAPIADEILDTLVTARLLTSYEVAGADDAETAEHRLEIVHESLLTQWPRLVRWRTQDREGALLRDQLRQAAQIWEERGRPNDLLWTGTSYDEYELWRERYSGGLTAPEESFARAMASHAQRRRRRRRLAIVALISGLALGLAIVAGFWRQAVQARDRAENERLRAEGSQLLALARLEVEDDSISAFAYALASLERADDPVTRSFLLEILAAGPLPLVVATDPAEGGLAFSPDGRWLAVGGRDGKLQLWPRAGGEPSLVATLEGPLRGVGFGGSSERIVALDHENHVVSIRSVPGGEIIRAIESGTASDILLVPSLGLLTFTANENRTRIQAWPLDGGEPRLLADGEFGLDGWYQRLFSWGLDVDPAAERLAYIPMDLSLGMQANGEVFELPMDDLDPGRRRLVARHAAETVLRTTYHPGRRLLATGGLSGEVRLWDLDSDTVEPLRVLRQPQGYVNGLRFDPSGSRLVASSSGQHVAVWELEGPPDATPLLLDTAPAGKSIAFDPTGQWLATGSGAGAKVWPVHGRYASVLLGHEDRVADQLFLPNGDALISASTDGTIRIWPLSPDSAAQSGVLLNSRAFLEQVTVDPAGERLLAAASTGQVWVVPLDGSIPREITTLDGIEALAIGSRYAGVLGESEGTRTLRIFDLETGQSRDFPAPDGTWGLAATPDGRLASATPEGLGAWDPEDGSFSIFESFGQTIDLSEGIFVSDDFQRLLVGGHGQSGEALLIDLVSGTSTLLDSHGPNRCGTLAAAADVVLTRPCAGPGPILVGPASGEVPHLVFGLDRLGGPSLSPDGRWIVAGSDAEIRLVPVPDLATPPLHTLEHGELRALLSRTTNVRVRADRESDTGWTLETTPFPGWEEGASQ